MTEGEWEVSTDPLAMLRSPGFQVLLENPPNYKGPLHKFEAYVLACTPYDKVWARWVWNRRHGLPTTSYMTPMDAAIYWSGGKVGQLHELRLSKAQKRERADVLHEVFGNPWRPIVCRTSGNRLGTDTVMVRSNGTLAGCECAWLTDTVMGLAEAAYDKSVPLCPKCEGRGESRDDVPYGELAPCETCKGEGRIGPGVVDRTTLLVLSDALEEAGCDNEAILGHLRSPGPHIYGCHVLDALLTNIQRSV